MKVVFDIATPPAVTVAVAIRALFVTAIIATFANPPTDVATPAITNIAIITIMALWKVQ